MMKIKDFTVGLFNTVLLPIISPFGLACFSFKSKKAIEIINCLWGLVTLALAILLINVEKPAYFKTLHLIIGSAAYVAGFFESVSEYQSDMPFSDSERANIYFLGTLSLSSLIFVLL